MRYGVFEKELLIAAYNEGRHHVTDPISLGDIIDRYPLRFQPGWIVRALDDFRHRGLISGRGNVGGERDQRIVLTGTGMKEAELLIDEGISIFRLDIGDGIGFPKNKEVQGGGFDRDSFASEAFDTGDAVPDEETIAVPSFASANWTGISARLSEGDRVKLTELSGSLIAAINQSELDDRSKTTARKHVEAILTLLEAPDPPWKAIVELLSNPALIAFLTAIDILRLIWGAAN